MKIKNYRFYMIAIWVSLFVCNSCIDETWPELDKNDENTLVVEGRISNLPGPYTVKLSRTQPMDSLSTNKGADDDFRPFENADVSIIDDLNNTTVLTEVEPGVYKTAEGGLQGVIGRSYKLSIVSSEGELYESDFEVIPEPVGVDTIYTKEELVDDVYLGYRFFVSSELNPNERNFYKWELFETYEYRTPYNPEYEFNGYFSNAYTDSEGVFHPGSYSTEEPYNIPKMPSRLDLNICWESDKVEGSYRETTKYMSTSKVDEFPLHFIHYSHIKLRVRYSLLVHQHSLTEKAYKYFAELEEQNSYDENELYTKQPYQMRGNVRNINNSGEAVLGYFYTTGVSQKRMFAPPDKRPEHDNTYAVFYCHSSELLNINYDGVAGNDNMDLFLPYMQNRPSIWPVYFGDAYIYHPDRMPWAYEVIFSAYPKHCYDCREKGGHMNKPDYWD